MKNQKKTYGSIRTGFGRGVLKVANEDSNVVVLCADLTDSLKLGDFKEKYPNRFFQMGIAEQNMLGAAAGMCLNNKIPFAASYAVFNPGRNWDQLRVSVCYSNHNVKIVGGHAGLTTGPDGATHQALEDIAITRVLPNLTVVVPCDELEAEKATIAMAKHKGPVYIRLSREKSENITDEKTHFELGKANILKKGKDISIFSCGICVQFALDAAEELEKVGISSYVVNLHTIKPIDKKTIIELAKKTRCVLTVEEHQKAGGMGSAICDVLAENYPVPVSIIGVEDTFGESGEGYELLDKYGLSSKNIVARAKELVKSKKK